MTVARQFHALDCDLRPVRHCDIDALRAFAAGCSDQSIYRRFFGWSRSAVDRYLTRLVTQPDCEQRACAAWCGERVVGLAAFDLVGPDEAEISLLVTDANQHQGVGTRLLHHVIDAARNAGVHHLTAEVLGENHVMARLLQETGLRLRMRYESGVGEVELDVPAAEPVTAPPSEQPSGRGRRPRR